MTEQKLSRVSGTLMGLGPAQTAGGHTYYQHLWMRESEERDSTIRDVSAADALSSHLVAGTQVTLYLVESPSKRKCLFGIDAGSYQADDIDAIGRDQAKAFKAAIKWVLLSIPLCLVLVGFVVLPLAIRGMILLSRAPKPKDMRAFLAAHRAAA